MQQEVMIHPCPRLGQGPVQWAALHQETEHLADSTGGVLEGGWMGRFWFLSVRAPSSGPGLGDALLQCLE